ncbi:related to O-succinylhomoserine (thiol)-lyase [Cephalotrichum gorgonifer]|uniref:cystathionine gamma-synthase n=1 Tax=Cephalotrichum gorgonifer TaxID=2041049 RepID=A0AAE8MW44_9PEZI|nr:related to O-succinylhomoserine (thiol)-lyase [Cephalotrichum gorgonifer]
MSQANLEHAPSEAPSRVSSWVEANGTVVPRAADAGSARDPLPGNGGDAYPTILRRTITTTTTTTYERIPPATTTDQGGIGSAMAGLLGAAVGMGVGAALTYTSMKNDSARSAPPEYNARSHHQPMSSVPRGPGAGQGDWVEVARDAERYPYSDQYGALAAGREQPQYLMDRGYARSSAGSQSRTKSDRKPAQRIPLGRGWGCGQPRVRTESRVGDDGMGCCGTSGASSRVGSQHSAAGRSSVHRSPADVDSASRVSARSQKSAAAPGRAASIAPSAHGGSVARSKACSVVSASTVKAPTVVRAGGSSNASRRGSVVSARHVPLPRSTTGSCRSSNWDDLESIAPSESISCIDEPRSRAVSVSLPTWKANVGYEEGEKEVISKMNGRLTKARFFIHKSITAFADEIVTKHASPGQNALLFPTPRVARRCLDYIRARLDSPANPTDLSIVDLGLAPDGMSIPFLASLSPTISAVTCSPALFSLGRQYWQHTGDGISSRRAEFCHELYRQELLVPVSTAAPPTPPSPYTKPCRAPRRYHRPSISEPTPAQPKSQRAPGTSDEDESLEWSRFLEERFGRNLDLSLVQRASSAIKRRIAGAVAVDLDRNGSSGQTMAANTRGIVNLEESDIYLFPCGMNAIYTVYRALSAIRPTLKTINLGFPYVDTLKILEKFGPGCVFYGHGSSEELDELEERLRAGERFMALFCEVPGNPLLQCPDLARVRRLADEFDFFVMIDETIGTFANINVLPFADVVVSSLTKIFSGDCNVMGGSALLNPNQPHYQAIKASMNKAFEDTYWPEDVVFMERNSRDFQSRVDRINANSEALCDLLVAHPCVKTVYYPKINASKPNYDLCKVPGGGYGGLLSIKFRTKAQAVSFFDALETAKGPSLGTNFTLTCPYVLIAHYQELDWAAQFGADVDLVRISVGLEETESLAETVRVALKAASGEPAE